MKIYSLIKLDRIILKNKNYYFPIQLKRVVYFIFCPIVLEFHVSI